MEQARRLPPEDFKEFKELIVAEFGEGIPDEEINDMAFRALDLYALLYGPSEFDQETFSKTEIVAFAYIVTMICDFQHSPSVREIARLLGRRSSRSGQQVLDRLIVKGLVERNRDGELQFGENAKALLTCLERKNIPPLNHGHA